MTTRAIIIGGGIGGLTTAIALRRAGIDALVCERVAELREIGAGLSLWANALKAFDQLGLAEPIRRLRVADLNGGLRSWRGDTLSELSSGRLETTFGEVSVIVHRAELLELLRCGLPPEAILLNANCVGFEQDRSGVTAHFADGRSVRGDLLIGADGLHSTIRAQLFGQQQPRYAGYTAWRAVTAFDYAPLRVSESWGCGVRFVQVAMSGARVYWFAGRNAIEGERDAAVGRKRELLQLFNGWHAPIEALIEATAEAAILRHDVYHRDPLRRWSDGRMTLLGDAAHPMTSDMGQGACQAIEDAVALAKCLGADGDVVSALRAYERRRIPRTTAIANQSWRFGQIAHWRNPLACRLRNCSMRLLPTRFYLAQLAWMAGYAV